MGSAKDLILKPISSQEANAIVKRIHYSGKVVNNSQIHIGVFWNGKLEGAMQFGPSLDKRKLIGLVKDTKWNEFIELNRMAFSEALPRNSESRAIAIAMRILKKHAPHLKWVISFADGAQCGDGTIYRASGFVLTSIKKNNQIWVMPDGEVATILVATDTRRPQRGRLLDNLSNNKAHTAVFSRMSLTDGRSKQQQASARKTLSRGNATKGNNITETGGASMKPFIEAGAKPLEGFQLRYLYFLDPTAKERLTVPILPFSLIDKMGAAMYKGVSTKTRAGSVDSDTANDQLDKGGATPTPALQINTQV